MPNTKFELTQAEANALDLVIDQKLNDHSDLTTIATRITRRLITTRIMNTDLCPQDSTWKFAVDPELQAAAKFINRMSVADLQEIRKNIVVKE